jgi:hypothetical protein
MQSALIGLNPLQYFVIQSAVYSKRDISSGIALTLLADYHIIISYLESIPSTLNNFSKTLHFIWLKIKQSDNVNVVHDPTQPEFDPYDSYKLSSLTVGKT